MNLHISIINTNLNDTWYEIGAHLKIKRHLASNYSQFKKHLVQNWDAIRI